MKIAFPSNNPGGLQAGRSDHFGHCEVFTVVEIDDQRTINTIETIVNHGHGAGGCMTPVKLLKDAGVEAIVVGGLGARPMQGFAQVGIDVYFAAPDVAGDVQGLINLFVDDQLPKMQPTQVCQGSGACHH